jgi:hypothetical protein
VNLSELLPRFLAHGCKVLYAKPLAENDNSKNQIYLGPDFEAVNLLPNYGVRTYPGGKRPNFKASLDFYWLTRSGQLSHAPGAQLILYPDYPEVRLSGFLRGSDGAPSNLLNRRLTGRVLLLGVASNGATLGYVALQHEVPLEAISVASHEQMGVFHVLDILRLTGHADTKSQLITALRAIHEKSWIDSKQLRSDGMIDECNAPQCGGFTLEAELGIPKNSKAEPDYLGYEVKQHQVTSFERPGSGSAITLMTPEPKMGFYADNGVVAFIRRFGYADKVGREDRINFGGIHKVNVQHSQTQLTLVLDGYDAKSGKIVKLDGAIALFTAEGEMAAGWSFEEMLRHWTKKHAKAVYVPSLSRTEPRRQYTYGHTVRIAEQTDFLKLLKAFHSGEVYYDPGIKLEQVSSAKPKEKRRSQFRIASKNIPSLYRTVDNVRVSNG